LPQTQCTRCGYDDCRSYAEAVAEGEADIDQCPPGGAEGIARLAAVTGRPAVPLNPANGVEGPLRLARIDETWCIGCTLCIQACPVDCIVGAPKRMHTVVESQCTGCELCVPACPVDCIDLVAANPGRTGWSAWSEAQAAQARERYAHHRDRAEQRQRLERQRRESAAPVAPDAKRQAIEAAMARARALRNPSQGQP